MTAIPQRTFEEFATALVPRKPALDPTTLQAAKDWYKGFAGTHAVKMDDAELVTIFLDLSM